MDKQQGGSPGVAGSPVMYEDEIDLFALWQVLVRYKVLILAAVTVFVLAAIVYAFVIATPIYKAEVSLSSPSEADIVALNQYDGVSLTPNKVFMTVRGELYSKKLRRKLFDELNLQQRWLENRGATSSNVLFRNFDESLTVDEQVEKFGDKDVVSGIEVRLTGYPVTQVVEVLNQFVSLAVNAARDKLVRDIQARVKDERGKLVDRLALTIKYARVKRLNSLKRMREDDAIAILELEKQINSLRKKAGEKLRDRRKALKVALGVAEELGIKRPVWRSGGSLNEAGLMVNPSFFPLYEKGSLWLSAELDALNERKGDAFVPGIRGMQEKLANLKNNNRIKILMNRTSDEAFDDDIPVLNKKIEQLDDMKMHPELFLTAVIEKPAYVNPHPIKPKRMLIVLLALCGGLMFGVFAAFFAEFVGKAKARRENLSL